MREFFRRFAHNTATMVGTVWAFLIALLMIIIWAFTGPIFQYSDTWQLVINTSTTIITFLMVFLIQNTQNRDSREVHLKLDELLRAIKPARTSMAFLEDLSDAELEKLHQQFTQLKKKREEKISSNKQENGNTQKGK
jgi:low affinity Fe/Cu permease